MKKILLCTIISLFSLANFGSTISLLDNAITWAYTKKLTIYLNADGFKPNSNIRRDEAAKFFVNFAKLIGKTDYIVNANQCQFSDKNQARDDLQDTIVESCRLGLFKGKNGKFNPTGNITNAEAITVLVRLLNGYQSESGNHRANNYYKRANELELLKNVNMTIKDVPAQRGEVLITLYDARNKSFYSPNSAEVLAESNNWVNPYNEIKYGESTRKCVYKQDEFSGNRIFVATPSQDMQDLINSYLEQGYIANCYRDGEWGEYYINIYDPNKDVSSILKEKKVTDKLNQLSQIHGLFVYKLSDSQYIQLNRYTFQRGSVVDCIQDVRLVARIEHYGSVKEVNEYAKNICEVLTPNDLYSLIKGETGSLGKYRDGYFLFLNGKYEIMFEYVIIDNDSIYRFRTPTVMKYYNGDDTYYQGWLIGTVKKSDGKYPRLKYFGDEKVSIENIDEYLKDLFEGKQTSNYFTTQLNILKAEIDKLYQ